MALLLPSARSARFFVIVFLTWISSAPAGFTHVVAGLSRGGLRRVRRHRDGAGTAAGRFLVPTLIGNTIGGVAFVALLNHARRRTRSPGGEVPAARATGRRADAAPWEVSTARMTLDLAAYLRGSWTGRQRPLTTRSPVFSARTWRRSLPGDPTCRLRVSARDPEGVQEKLVQRAAGATVSSTARCSRRPWNRSASRSRRHRAAVIVVAPRRESPRTYMILTAGRRGTYAVDLGFGALAPRAPLPLVEGVEVRLGHETHWFCDATVTTGRAHSPPTRWSIAVFRLDDDNLGD